MTQLFTVGSHCETSYSTVTTSTIYIQCD